MKITEISQKLEAVIINPGDTEADIKSVYAGDFLSRVMGKAPENSVWLTVINNINVAGVAVLAEIRAVVLCEGVEPDALLKQKCALENIALLSTQKTVYECCKVL